MSKRIVLDFPKVWFQFSKSIGGKILRFRWEKLTEHRYNDFIDFLMTYYVKYEIAHVAAGVPKNPKAMEDYRKTVTKLLFENPSYHNDICCLDDGQIVAFNTVLLYNTDEIFYGFTPQGQTTEIKKFIDIHNEFHHLFPLPEILSKYGVNKYMEDMGFGIHTEYRGYDLTSTCLTLRNVLGKKYAVPMTGGWITALASQRATKRDGWETIYKVSSDQLEKKLGVTFKNNPPILKYKIKRYF